MKFFPINKSITNLEKDIKSIQKGDLISFEYSVSDNFKKSLDAIVLKNNLNTFEIFVLSKIGGLFLTINKKVLSDRIQNVFIVKRKRVSRTLNKSIVISKRFDLIKALKSVK